MSNKSNRNSWIELLVSYFANIKYAEERIEFERVKLYSHNDFNPEHLFNFIDINKKNSINLNDFRNYLNNNNIPFNEEVIRKLIHNFDKDNDFCLDFSEFLNIITPKKNKNCQEKNLNFNKIKQNINIYSNCDNFNINDKINKCFATILIEEMKLIDQSNEIIESIIKSKDFITYEAFVEIAGQEKYINEANLLEFFIKTNIELNKDDVHQLLFRLDADNDGVISYQEFQKIFTPLKIESSHFIYNQPPIEAQKVVEDINFTGKNNKNKNRLSIKKTRKIIENQIDDDIPINNVYNNDLSRNKNENKSDIHLNSIESSNFKEVKKTVNLNYTNNSERLKSQKQNKKNSIFNTKKSADKKIRNYDDSFKKCIHLSERTSKEKLKKVFRIPVDNKTQTRPIYNTTNNTIKRHFSSDNNKFSIINDLKLNYDYSSCCNNDDLLKKKINNFKNDSFKDSPLMTNNTNNTNYTTTAKTKITKKKVKIPFSTRKKTEAKSKLKLFDNSTVKNTSDFRKNTKSESRNGIFNDRVTPLSYDNNRSIKFNNSFSSNNICYQTLRNNFIENSNNEKEVYKRNKNDNRLQNLINSPSPYLQIINNTNEVSKKLSIRKEVENDKRENLYSDNALKKKEFDYLKKTKNYIKSNSFINGNNLQPSIPKKFTNSYLKNQNNTFDNKKFHIFDGIQNINNQPKKIFANNLNYTEINKNKIDINNDLYNNSDNDIKIHSLSSPQEIENSQYENSESFNISQSRYSFDIHSNRCINLFNLFKDILEKETKLKNFKQIISNCKELNNINLFNIFDVKKRKLISYSDICSIVNKLGSNIDLKDIKYIFLRNNKNIKMKIDYQEFIQLFVDEDNQRNDLMCKKNVNRVDDLSIDSKQKISQMLSTIIECEKSNEYYRNILAMTPNSSGYDLFKFLKKKDCSGIDKEDITNFVNSFDKNFTDNEILIIFKKLNKNNGNIVDYTQFVSEMTPKSIN